MEETIPQAFIWRRLHSLTGFFFALFLIEHLLVNSQAALFLGDNGEGFVNAVNSIHNFPYLPVIEFFFLGIPILIHMAWGIKYLQTSQANSYGSGGTAPHLPQYHRNKAYTWQRITSWILLFAVIAHVIHMRFIEEPLAIRLGSHEYYLVRVSADDGLPSVAERLNVKLLNNTDIATEKAQATTSEAANAVESQRQKQQQHWLAALQHHPLKDGQVFAQAPDFGTAELLMVRDSFKSPLLIALYTIFVLAACFHGFNGLWSFMIRWGFTISRRSQAWMLKISTFIMILVAFMGLAAIWGTYWLNLKQ